MQTTEPTNPSTRRQARDRRARGALLSGRIFVARAQAGIGLALALWFPPGRGPYYGHKAGRLKGRLDGGPSALSVVMLGSSRTAHGFAPRPLEAVLAHDLGRPVVA